MGRATVLQAVRIMRFDLASRALYGELRNDFVHGHWDITEDQARDRSDNRFLGKPIAEIA